MASISSRAKHFIQPAGGFLGIARFTQEDGNAENRMDMYGFEFEDFIKNHLKKQPFPEPYNTFEKAMRLVKKTILDLVFLENEIEPAMLFEDALKGAANIGDSAEAERLFMRINNSDRNFRGLIEGNYDPNNDILDDRMIESVCDLISFEYYVNPRYSGTHTSIHISNELANYLFDIVTSIIHTCIFCPWERERRPYIYRQLVGAPTFFRERYHVLDRIPSLLPAYTRTVNSGSIDMITYKTVWKIFFSSSKKPKPTTPETLEVLMQYIMVIKAEPTLEDTLEYLGIYDPNRNLVYTLKIEDIPQDIIETVYSEVIGY